MPLNDRCLKLRQYHPLYRCEQHIRNQVGLSFGCCFPIGTPFFAHFLKNFPLIPFHYGRNSDLYKDGEFKMNNSNYKNEIKLRNKKYCHPVDGCHTTHRMIPTFVLDPLGIGNHQKAGCVPAPRESHPSEVLSELPPLVATVLSRSTCGWTGVSLS